MQNQQLSNNYQQRENINNNSSRNIYWDNHFLGNRNNNYNNFSSKRIKYPNSNRYYNYNNFLRMRNNDNRQEHLNHNRYANHRQFSNQYSQREMGNQQLSRTI